MRRAFSMGALVAAVPLALVGCGGSGGGTLAFEELGPAIIAASCRITALCEESPDEATCVASNQITPGLFETLAADIATGLVRYDAHAARACVDIYPRITDCTFTAIGRVLEDLDATCSRVFSGTVPPGGACFFNEECANRGSCDRPSCSGADTCCVGTCVARPMIPNGGDCSQPESECVAGTACAVSPQSLTQLTCQPLLGPNAACTTTNDACDSPYACVAADPQASAGMCTAPPGPGEACGGTTGLGTICNDVRDECDPNAHVCTARNPIGVACATGTGHCAALAVCDGVNCIARGRPGDACSSSIAGACLGAMECDATMHCALRPKGASCR